jgi:hypothetical protein
MPDTYKEGDILQNDQGQKIVLRNNQWVPALAQFAPGSMQKKPGGPVLDAFQQEHPLRAIPPTILQSFGIDPAQVEGAKSYLDALKSAGGNAVDAAGEQMFESLAKAGPLAPVHMLGKGIDSVATQFEEGSKKAYDSYRTGDRFGLTQGLAQVASSLGQLALLKAAKPIAEQSTELTGRAVRGAARAPLGVGPVAEQFAGETHAADVAANEVANREAARQLAEKNNEITTKNVQAVSEARQTHEQAVKKIEEENAKAAEDHEQTKNRINAQYKRDTQKFEQARSGQSLTAQGKGARPSVTSEASGATRARLQAWSDKVNEIATKTKATLKDSLDRRYDAFRQSLKNNPSDPNEVPQVNWTPVQQAVADAEKNILTGSPESVAIFRNIMKEGPQLDEASVFHSSQATEAAQNLKDLLRSKQIGPKGYERAMAALHAQGLPVDDATGLPSNTVSEDLQIPHKDAWGYAQELNAKLNGAHLPSDVYRAIKSVREAAGKVLQEAADSKGAGAAWQKIQGDYSEYAQRFLDHDSPLYKLLNSTNPEDRLSLIAGKEGQNLIDALHKYRGFGGDTEIAGKIRALRAAGSKIVDQLREPTRGAYPNAPEPKPLPTEAAYPGVKPTETLDPSKLKPTEPFDPNAWRKERLRKYQETLAQRQPPSQWQMLQIPFFRAMSRLYSNPAFVKLVLGIK